MRQKWEQSHSVSNATHATSAMHRIEWQRVKQEKYNASDDDDSERKRRIRLQHQETCVCKEIFFLPSTVSQLLPRERRSLAKVFLRQFLSTVSFLLHLPFASSLFFFSSLFFYAFAASRRQLMLYTLL